MISLIGRVACGLGIGLAVILPGMSAGTAALLLGVYEELVVGIVRFRWRPLGPIVAGIAAGVLAGAHAVRYLLHQFPDGLNSFLVGLVVASGVVMLRRKPGRRRSAGPWVQALSAVAFLGGLGAALLLAPEPLGRDGPIGGDSAGDVFLAGFAGGSAMVLPGISGGTVLVLLGQYERMLKALSTLDVRVLLLFSAGAAAGTLVLARLMEHALERHRDAGTLFLAGLVFGSVRAVLPGRFGLGELVAATAGLALVLLTAQAGQRRRAG